MSMTVPHQRPHPDQFGRFALQARTELLALAPNGSRHHGLGPEVYRAVAGRGTSVRVIEELSPSPPGQSAPPSGQVQLRCLVRVPHTLVLVDRQAALLTPRGAAGVTVTVRQPALLEALSMLFTTLWQQARPERPESTHRQRDGDVLDLLARGSTDESAAVALGVSIRTYRRWVADLMTRLGATSRFQAGLLASRNGWCNASADAVTRRRRAVLTPVDTVLPHA